MSCHGFDVWGHSQVPASAADQLGYEVEALAQVCNIVYTVSPCVQRSQRDICDLEIQDIRNDNIVCKMHDKGFAIVFYMGRACHFVQDKEHRTLRMFCEQS